MNRPGVGHQPLESARIAGRHAATPVSAVLGRVPAAHGRVSDTVTRV